MFILRRICRKITLRLKAKVLTLLIVGTILIAHFFLLDRIGQFEQSESRDDTNKRAANIGK